MQPAHDPGPHEFARTLVESITATLSECEGDVLRSQQLLSDAIAGLLECLGSDTTLDFTASMQQQANTQTATDHAAQAGDLRARLSAAITNLQFQDLVNQLLGQVERRMTGMRDVLTEVSSRLAAAGVNPNGNIWSECNDMVLDRVASVRTSVGNKIRQQSMNAGDVELF